MQAIFGPMPGYRQTKLLRQAHGTVCFVDFEDIETATAAHTAAQGMTLNSGGQGPCVCSSRATPGGASATGRRTRAARVLALAERPRGMGRRTPMAVCSLLLGSELLPRVWVTSGVDAGEREGGGCGRW